MRRIDPRDGRANQRQDLIEDRGTIENRPPVAHRFSMPNRLSHPTDDPNWRDYCYKSHPYPHQAAILLARNSKSSRVTRSERLISPFLYVDLTPGKQR